MSILKTKSIISLMIIFSMILCMATPIFAAESNNITIRNLAMFATISYANLEEINNYNVNPDTDINQLHFYNHNMVTDAQLASITSSTVLLGINLSGQVEDTYTYLFYNLATTNEVNDWKLVNYAKMQSVNGINKNALFTAMTFKRNNDIVIAYRGTDFDDLGDWLQDITYGIAGKTGQEELAQNYAIKVAEQYPNSNIYVTGHSLGGYLAQIGGAKLLQSNYRGNVREIGYFNGMGLYFWSNLRDSLLKAKIITQETYDAVTDPNTLNNRYQSAAKTALEGWYAEGGKLVSYHINGDPISSLGTHCGKSVGFDSAEACIGHHHYTDISFESKVLDGMYKTFRKMQNKYNKLQEFIDEHSLIKFNNYFETKALNALNLLISEVCNTALNTDISPYINKYDPTTLIGYIWTTHETDSFFGQTEEKLEISFNAPKTIVYKKNSTVTLTVNTGGAELQNPYLKVSDFSSSNTRRSTIVSVSNPTVKKVNNENIYTYTITVKGGLIIGKSNLTLKPNVLYAGSLKNRATASDYFKTKLR